MTPEESELLKGDGRHQYPGSTVYRKISVKGNGGVTVTVIVTVYRGKVWLSIDPPFTWEAIIDPGKVDELMRTLGVAAKDARRMMSNKSLSREGTQPASNETAVPGNGVLHTKKVQP